MCLFCQQEFAQCRPDPQIYKLRLKSAGAAAGASVHSLDVYGCIAYDRFIRTLIRSWKYDGVIQLTEPFAHMMTEVIVGQAGGKQNLRKDIADVIVPVPSTVDRTQKRGYDHVRLLAHQISSYTQIPVAPALYRESAGDGFTQSQTAKSANERLAGVAKEYRHNRQIPVRGRRVMLVDDIVTTGSTLVTCANRLYQSGAQHVTSIVLARVL